MKFFLSLVVLAAAATAASPALLTKRAVYPQEGQVCCRHDRAENCVGDQLYPTGLFSAIRLIWRCVDLRRSR
ncbi:hypothetical protein CLIM01_02622 [Colletotrichum limetticola]|uniref:Uncharacterized protein n=1 Tax=Colletotrichum limetticola TaxID=1209924 RepID=A0ABQ9Q846_9PEZI|nr:hypothetical protein CLIM01_02622 [Colletotrichum limetticola]